MAIHRSGPTPTFYDYVCKYPLIPHANPPSPLLMALVGPGQQLDWVDIPTFQRGISWDIENVKDLLQSNSILLGNAILSQLAVPVGQFPYLPVGQPVYHLLVDGLQRFAVGTALLAVLHDLVLSNSPNRPGDAIHFTSLTARVTPFSAFYFHNNAELLAHPRQAVRDQYSGLRNAISDYCNEELNSGHGSQFAAAIVRLFVSRQLALDIYFNFNRLEVLNTFIGINTVRVDLGPVDLLRASILECATGIGWPQSDLELTENGFTDTLTDNQKPKQDFMPFVNAALKTISSGKGSRLFPSWNVGLLKADVDSFLDFMEAFENAITSNLYLSEIRSCGRLPISTVFAHYYLDYIHGSKLKPAFMTSGSSTPSASDADLHSFLITCYRLVIDGTVGRTSEFLEQLIDDPTAPTLQQLADRISVKYLGRNTSSNLDSQWLETQLNKIDQKRAPRIFNALLLPMRTNLGATFKPIPFSRSAKAFHIDHLIPESLLKQQSPGGLEGQRLRNFAPLPTNQNRIANATACSAKLAPGGIYALYCAGAGSHFVHPYCQWLIATYTTTSPPMLDSQANLEKNSLPDIGTARIAKILAELLPRI